MKFSKLLSHARHNTIAYIALFVALGGTAAAASPYIKNGDPAGGDLTGTYPNPSIASGAVTSLKILDGTITATDVASANNNNGTSPAFDLFYVPEGDRPAGAGAYAVAKGNNVSIVDVGPNGTVLIPSGIAPGEAVSLDGLNWRAG